MRHSQWIVAALMCAAPLFAEEAEKKKIKAIPATPVIAPDAKAPADASAEIKALTLEYNKATAEFFRPYREARANGETYKLDYAKHPRTTYKGKFAAIAEKYAGQDEALDAWVMVLRCGGDRNKVAAIVMRDHIQSKSMTNVIGYLRWQPNGDELMRKIIAESPHREVQGFAMLMRGETMLRNGHKDAEAVLMKVVSDYGDVKIYGGRMTAGSKAEGNLFEARNLSIGKTAPDIEGEDIDGVVFKLSDYRGKVVVLDFWGDW